MLLHLKVEQMEFLVIVNMLGPCCLDVFTIHSFDAVTEGHRAADWSAGTVQ
jgi:uncharacterized protein YcgI (DUF1989 family)